MPIADLPKSYGQCVAGILPPAPISWGWRDAEENKDNPRLYLPALAATNLASTAFQFTVFHQASMYAARRFWYFR